MHAAHIALSPEHVQVFECHAFVQQTCQIRSEPRFHNSDRVKSDHGKSKCIIYMHVDNIDKINKIRLLTVCTNNADYQKKR